MYISLIFLRVLRGMLINTKRFYVYIVTNATSTKTIATTEAKSMKMKLSRFF